MWHQLGVAVTCVLVSVQCDNSAPVVEAPAGKFMGHMILKSRGGRDILSFEGIPYAKPPVGELRLKDPEMMPAFNGTYDATNDSIQCYQPSLDFSQSRNISTYSGREDCLFLNIHTPKVDEGTAPMPVIFWIHGGGFYLGSGKKTWQGPEYLLDNDVIFVTINYRLGILGYLTTGDDVIPGNFGMKDQIMALKWVKENIAAFGGDPDSVTIAGESAGGSAVSLLMHSPLAKGLFHKVISQSGTAFSSYATKPWKAAKEDARDVATYLGCVFKSETFLKCLQKMPIEELTKAAISIIPDEMTSSLNFVPVVEDESGKAFLTVKSLDQAASTPFITGVTSREAMYMMQTLTANHDKYKGDLNKMKQDLEVLMELWGNYVFHPDKTNITDSLAKFYFGDGGFPNATEVQLIDYMSDIMFNYGSHLAAKKEQGPTYMYMLSYKGGDVAFIEKLPKNVNAEGVSHGEDLKYLFTTFLFKWENGWSKEDMEMSKTMVDMWYNFAKNGNPTPDTKLWEESENGVKYLDMTNKGLVMKKNMFQDRMNFLDQLNIDRNALSA